MPLPRARIVVFDSCGGRIRHCDPAARSARSYKSTVPSRKQRAQGKPGAHDTRSRAQKCTRRTAGAPEHPAFPAQWFYGLCRDLPGAEFLWPPSPTDWRSIEARSGPTISISLTPATGARTTRFCRPQLPRTIRSNRPACCRRKFRPRRLSAVRLTRRPIAHGNNRPANSRAPDAAASTATHPNVRDVGQRPSWRDRMAGVVGLIWVSR
jgi:hypothetical protein